MKTDFYIITANSDNYKLSNGKFVNVETVEGVISDFVETRLLYTENIIPTMH